jgi:maltose/moltooligosaccharide transporter
MLSRTAGRATPLGNRRGAGPGGQFEGILMEKPRQSAAGLWNISFGFFGIQIGFALQNANMSRVFQSLGSSIDDLPALWIAAPLTGLLVQPIVGHLSDRTWLGRFGRRRPYFLAGAILAASALLFMPQSTGLLMAAMLLWMLDASLNISMEPFRAFVGDMLRKDQHTAGYAVQTAFIGAGAVAGSLFPYLLDHFGVSNDAAAGGIPDTVRYSFWAGGVALFAAVVWTIVNTQEYSPEQLAAFGDAEPESPHLAPDLAARGFGGALIWIAGGALVAGAVSAFGLEKEVYLLAALLAGYGLATIGAILLARAGRSTSMLASIVGDFSGMPPLMKRLALVQFFSWSALFIMWINTTPVVAQNFFGSADPASAAYQEAGNWVGVLFSVYNGVAALAALLLLPRLSAKLGKARTHALCLLAGVLGYASFFVLHDPRWLILSEIGVGIAWASILAMPYAILASSLPQAKLGIYMGLFNIFVVIPQLLVATVMGSIMKALFPHDPIWTMAFAAATLAVAALASLRINEAGAEA